MLESASLQRRSTKIKSLIDEFLYPRLGPGQMWEMTAERIESQGGRVLMEHRVTGLENDGFKVQAVHVDTPEGPQRIAAEHFISTMPLRSLVRALDPGVPQVAESGEGLRYRDFLVVALILDQEDLFPDNWIYVHTPGVKVGRVQNFNNWSKDMVPEPGRTCLGLEYFCFKGDGLWSTPDDELIELAKRELGRPRARGSETGGRRRGRAHAQGLPDLRFAVP